MTAFDLRGRVAIATGGNGGIGIGIARGLAAAGATVVIAARDRDKTTAAIATIAKDGGKGDSIPTDIRQLEACRASDFVNGAAIPVDGGYSFRG